ncbi:M48 family metalloprotease [Candidatus Synechococcus calcipolaris G9]|uniref:M48 family metalloprotease n=1 Tax=Candidatus Synechococcus calcipolaris G9 TaxID=1497997 RepID=A0ABT6F2H4_9SYNE|nr:M48 family metalloprotease [Candidatus Synechococcus calcipolaris]MDG2992070.1 M48 family metalloprotease [Candidatus Synechococcus calcipolaris G9]
MAKHDSSFPADPRFLSGLAALNREDYTLAIAAFEAVWETHGDSSQGIKAQLHLVEAYTKAGQLQRATALCQVLSQSSRVKVKTWANRTLNILQEKYSDSPPIESPPVLPSRHWTRQSLRTVHGWRLMAIQVLTVGVIAWLLQQLIVAGLPPFLEWISRFWSVLWILIAWKNSLAWALVGVIGLILLSGLPWFWDLFLRWHYPMETMDLKALSQYSPEAVTLIGQLPWNWRQPQPKWGRLDTPIPLIFSYGHIHRRIIVSQGLLDALPDGALAGLIGIELMNLRRGYNVLASAMVLTLQLPYQFYLWFAGAGDRLLPQKKQDHGLFILRKILYLILGLVAIASYLIFKALEGLMFWSNRVRNYYGDRQGAALTGNPNGIATAWLELMALTASTVKEQRQMPALLERFTLLLPIDPWLGAMVGRLPVDWPAIVHWDHHHPLRGWLSLTASHRPFGSRLLGLMAYARYWNLEPLFHLDFSPRSKKSSLQRGWLQLTPFWGISAGLILAVVFWQWGQFALKSGRLAYPFWWFGELPVMLTGFITIGLGLGILLRINANYPTLRPTSEMGPPLSQLLGRSLALPLDSSAVQLQGRLLGPLGLRNCLGQNLFLDSPFGLWRLRCLAWWGPLWHVTILGQPSPQRWLGKIVTLRGWFRRSYCPWVEVDRLSCVTETKDDRPYLRCGAPYWATLIAFILIIYGILTFWGL